MRNAIKRLVPAALLAALAAMPIQADTLVPGLDTGDAYFTGGASPTFFAASNPDHSLGLTFGVQITPSAADVAVGGVGTENLITLLETGGVFSGTGLYLVEGVPLFISKNSTNETQGPNTLPDTNGGNEGAGLMANIAVKHTGGALTAGNTYKIHVVFDNTHQAIEFAVNGVQDNFTLTNVGSGWNWSGDDGINYLSTNAGITSRGGLNDLGGETDRDNAGAYTGSATEGAVWNATPNDIIVPLNPNEALYSGGDTSSFADNSTVVANPVHTRGLTFNIAFAPDATDLAANKTVLLMEVGGSQNGSGLYLVDGVPVFISKQNGLATDTPTDFDLGVTNDVDFTSDNTIAIASGFGALTADVEYVVAAQLDTQSGQLRLLIRDGETGNILAEVFDLTGQSPTGNWSGDDSVSVGFNHASNTSSRGALNSIGGNVFNRDSVQNFAGYLEDANYWNAIPTPTALPGGIALFATLALRRRRH